MPGWATQQLRLEFGEAMAKLSEIEPLADLFIQDQLRGSALLFFSNVLDALARDANRVAGVQHKVLGREIGTGLNALNPGLARGTLRVPPDGEAPPTSAPTASMCCRKQWPSCRRWPAF